VTRILFTLFGNGFPCRIECNDLGPGLRDDIEHVVLSQQDRALGVLHDYGQTFACVHAIERNVGASCLHHSQHSQHHLQGALSAELADLPAFRRFLYVDAFGEGWGLYAETLGYEIGFYKDPYAHFGALNYQMWRAIRLVVDTGIHALGWSRQQAIDYFKANAAKSEREITVEVDRYIASPGQALAYKIGQRKFQELRERAARELGPSFDLRQFHDAVLAEGALPLDVLETRIVEWIAQRKAQAIRN